MPVYQSTFIVTDHEISQIVNANQTLSSLAGQQAYLRVTLANGKTATLDLAQYILREPPSQQSASLGTIASSLTDLKIDAYKTTLLPAVDPNTDVITSRVVAYDANAAPDVTVSWTSLANPTSRNDIYQRSNMNDLVLSSKTRDFTNCLVSVNGVFHKTYLYTKELYVDGGYFNIKNHRQNKIAVFDTSGIGGHTILPIQMANIDASNATPFSGVTLSFPGVDFSNKTILLVLGGYLHALDHTYRLISPNRLMIDISKIDLINQFLHNPNTILTEAELNDAMFSEQLLQPPPTAPTEPPYVIPVTDKIIYYFTNQYPWARANTVAPFNIMDYTNHPPDAVGSPTTIDDIYAFLAAYPTIVPTGPSMLAEYEWTTKYERIISVIGSISTKLLQDDSFVFNTLLASNTFFVLINNPVVYKRHYPLLHSLEPDQHMMRGVDMPRGIMRYNDESTIPFVIYSNTQQWEHNISLNFEKVCLDAYKTAINPPAIPSPLYDLKADRLDLSAELLELFSPSS